MVDDDLAIIFLPQETNFSTKNKKSKAAKVIPLDNRTQSHTLALLHIHTQYSHCVYVYNVKRIFFLFTPFFLTLCLGSNHFLRKIFIYLMYRRNAFDSGFEHCFSILLMKNVKKIKDWSKMNEKKTNNCIFNKYIFISAWLHRKINKGKRAIF